MEWSNLLGTFGTIVLTAYGLFKYGAREKALREQIQGDLALIEELQKNPVLSDHTSVAWLHGKIVVDIARLARQPLGTKKRPIAWGSVALAVIVSAALGWWTYEINKGGFAWPSLITGLVAGLFAVSAIGLFLNREVAPDPELPPGAVAIRSESAEEQVAQLVALSAMNPDERFSDSGPSAAALEVFKLLKLGLYEESLDLFDPLWIECRVRSWLWNRSQSGEISASENLDDVLHGMLTDRKAHPLWADFVESEGTQFEEAWQDYGEMGVGSTRRRLTKDIDLVVVAPVGDSGGYYVSNATVLGNAQTFVMRYSEEGWRLLNHVGHAAPLPEWPPVWWMVNDSAIDPG